MDTAKCRGCNLELIGNPYHLGGIARHPETRKECARSHYGGYVCSDSCDDAVTRRMKESIDDHVTSQRRL